MRKLNEFRIKKIEETIIDDDNPRIKVYYIIQQKNVTIFGNIKWVNFIVEYCGLRKYWRTPRFYEKMDAETYLSKLNKVLK